jgi:uncharacterized protein (DUF58 family)
VVTTGALTPERVLRRLEWRVIRLLDGRLQGNYRSLFRGSGLDVAELREYEPGDDLRSIDWNVTARTDIPHVREYLEDRELSAWLVLDRSPSMGFGPVDRQKHLVLTEVAAIVAQLLARGGNRVGALLFDAGVERTIPPGHGRNQVLRIIAAVAAAPDPNTRPSGAATDLAGALTAIGGIARRRSLVVVVSDFHTDPSWARPLGQLARRHDVVPIQISDRREFELPAVGGIYVEDAETGEQIYVDTDDAAFRQRLEAAARQREEELVAAARSAGTDLYTVATDEDLVRALARIAEQRRRRRR